MGSRRERVLEHFTEQADYMQERISAGIEQYRKGRFSISVKDKEGNPVPGARIALHQKKHEFRFGANLFALEEMETPEKTDEYKRLYARLFNIGTLPFYWKFVEPENGKKRYAKGSPRIYRKPNIDLCLEFCEEYGIEPKAHCLDYDSFSPDWVKAMNDLDAIRNALYDRFEELSKLYADRVPSWEVTNETLNLPYSEHTIHFQQPDTIEWDFRMANRLFPKNKLIINEAHNNLWPVFNGNRSAYYMLIERALNKGCRIDSIGMQFHVCATEENEPKLGESMYSPERIYAVLDRYADFGKPIQITEISVPCYRNTEEDEDIQAEIIKNLYSIWFSHPAMEAIIYWDVIDGYEWTDNICGLLRQNLAPKKAYTVLDELINETWRTDLALATNDAGRIAFKGFYGDYDATICMREKTVTQTVRLSKNAKPDFTFTIS